MSESNRPKLSVLDRLINEMDFALRATNAAHVARRPSPGADLPAADLSDEERRRAAGLMRVNHSGEICAQALYRAQAATSRNADVRRRMRDAAEEEVDHLAWCEERLRQLGARPSLLNPVWHGLSLGLGALAGLAGDKINLGFLNATEELVGDHLQSHLRRLPEADDISRGIVSQMLEDERGHAEQALAAGGARFPRSARRLMRWASKLMTVASYRI